MESDSSSSGDTLQAASTKRKRYSQKYKSSWEELPSFKGWLKRSTKGSSFAYCSACDVHLSLTAGKRDIQAHAKGKKHAKNCSAVKQPSVLHMPSVSGRKKLDDAVKESELRLATFICEHDLPLRTVDHLPQLIQSMCPDSEIAKNMKCHRTKLTAMIKNVTGKYSSSHLIDHLKCSKFSLIVDESTDKGCTKHLCMVARTLIDDKIQDCFLGLIPVTDASAHSLYNSVINFFIEHRIPYKENMVGFGSDGANVMLGAHNSLASRLKNDVSGLFVMKCICHSFALCASQACLKLPRFVEDLARDVYSYFSCSPKRMGSLEEFQAFVKVKPHKLLHPSQTRWLSLHMVVSRLLEQYDALKLYFVDAVLSEKLLACEDILKKLNDPTTKLYLYFLDFVLPIFNSLNKQMQSESTQIHVLHKSVSSCLRTILDCYMQDGYLNKTPLTQIAPCDPHHFKPLSSMYLGAKVGMALTNQQNIPSVAIEDFRKRCLAFYTEAALQIMKRFPLSDTTMQNLEALDPSNVKHRSIPSLAPLMAAFPSLVTNETVQAVDTEWRLLQNTDLDIQAQAGVTPIKFWIGVRDVKSGDNTPLFPHLSQFILSLLILPHSSATVERIFSAINRMKTKYRTRLSSSTITGMLHTKRFLSQNACHKVKLPPALAALMNKDMYVSDVKESEESEEEVSE